MKTTDAALGEHRQAGETPADYRAMMRLAHQRSMPLLNTPSLTCHLGFRLRQDDDPLGVPFALKFEQLQDKRIATINALIRELRAGDHPDPLFRKFPPSAVTSSLPLDAKHMRALGTLPEAAAQRARAYEKRARDDTAGAFGDCDPGRTLHVKLGAYCCFEVLLSVAIHTEFTTLTFAAWLTATPDRTRSCNDCCKAAGLSLQALVEPNADAFNHRVNANSVYSDFWESYFAHKAIAFSALGEQFANFQGVLLRIPLPSASPGSMPLQEQIRLASAPEVNGSLIEALDVADAPSSAGARIADWMNIRQDGFRHILGYGAHDGMGNAVLCKMFGGFAVYGSNLTPIDDPEEPSTVRYFVVYAGPSRHQLARLVRMLHRCGEFRLAALFDFPAVRQASDEIRQLELMMNASMSEFNGAAQKLRNKRVSEWRRVSELIGERGRGGLLDRVYRTHNYFRSLRQRIDHLRTKRIVGWQSYDGFIQRNLYRHFEHVDDVGTRYEHLLARLRRLDSWATVEDLARQQRALVRLSQTGDLLGALATIAGLVVMAGIAGDVLNFNAGVHATVCARVACSPDVEPSHVTQIVVFALCAALLGLWHGLRALHRAVRNS